MGYSIFFRDLNRKARLLIDRFREELSVYQIVIRDPRTSWPARILLSAAIAYALSPIDLIPDFIPGIGHLDDLLIVPCLLWLAKRLISGQIIQDARNAVRNRSDPPQKAE